jgi:hypothetical protein
VQYGHIDTVNACKNVQYGYIDTLKARQKVQYGYITRLWRPSLVAINNIFNPLNNGD